MCWISGPSKLRCNCKHDSALVIAKKSIVPEQVQVQLTQKASSSVTKTNPNLNPVTFASIAKKPSSTQNISQKKFTQGVPKANISQNRYQSNWVHGKTADKPSTKLK